MAFIRLKRTNGTNCVVNCDQIMVVTAGDQQGAKVLLPDAVIEVTETVQYVENLIAQNYQVATSLESL